MDKESKNLARARATLKLPRNCSLREATRAYKRLVRRWHPDRFAADPPGAAEAALQLREINRAFAVLRQSLAGHQDPPADATTSTTVPARLRESTKRPQASSINHLSRATDVESDFTALGRTVYWSVVLGLAILLIAQPSPSGGRSEPAAIAGIMLLSVAGGHFMIKKWLERH